MTTPHDTLLPVLAGYKAAVFAKDVDTFVALYDDAVHIFDMWEDWSCSGIAPWRAMTAEWFASLGDERVVVDFSEVQASAGTDLAVVHAFVTYLAIAADGAELRSLDNRITLAMQHQAGAWKIVHQHTSSPIAFETGKFKLKR